MGTWPSWQLLRRLNATFTHYSSSTQSLSLQLPLSVSVSVWNSAAAAAVANYELIETAMKNLRHFPRTPRRGRESLFPGLIRTWRKAEADCGDGYFLRTDWMKFLNYATNFCKRFTTVRPFSFVSAWKVSPGFSLVCFTLPFCVELPNCVDSERSQSLQKLQFHSRIYWTLPFSPIVLPFAPEYMPDKYLLWINWRGGAHLSNIPSNYMQ